MKSLDDSFDYLFSQGCRLIPYGSRLSIYYANNKTFARFVKYGSWIMLEYWLVKGPMTMLFTEILGLWYVLSAFIAGTVCTIIGFFLSNYWIWRKRR